MRDLASRLREIVQSDLGERVAESAGRPPKSDALGGVPVDSAGACVAIECLWARDRLHGRARIDDCAPDPAAPIHMFDSRIAAGSDWWRHVVFFDIETTGLSGGAGTLAFLAGFGWFEEEGFRIRQFLLAGPSGERAMLDAVGRLFAGASLLVTFNGRTFDVPFMDTRWAFHRSASPAGDLAHFDMLPPARRLWSRRAAHREAGTGDYGCSLSALEQTVLGLGRHDDVPGFEIPSRYFHFLRTGDATGIEGVLEHNRYDLVSLAAIMSQALRLAREGPDACRDPAEQLALGRLYEGVGETARARDAYARATRSADADVRRHALAHLAVRLRRDDRHEEAAEAWQGVLEMAPNGSRQFSPLDRRAAEALAIHHEHRRKDLAAARRYAETLGRQASPPVSREADRRIRRLDRKIDAWKGREKLEL